MTQRHPQKSIGQLIWGIALTLVGIGVFFRIPQVMPKLAEIEQFSGAMGFIRFCLYLMGIMLVGGGIKKMVTFVKPSSNHAGEQTLDRSDG